MVRLAGNETNLGALKEGRIIFGIYTGCSGQHDVVAVTKVSGGGNHGRQVVLNLLSATAGKESNNGHLFRPPQRGGVAGAVISPQVLPDFRCCGIADIMDGVVVLLLEKVHLEGKNTEQLVDIALDILDAVLLPRPYLRRDIVVNFGLWRLQLLDVLGDAEVEARVVDENDDIGLPLTDIFLTPTHIF